MNEKKHILNQVFDAVYVLNLPFDYKRKICVTHLLEKENIDFEYFAATNGREGDAAKVWSAYIKRPLGQLQRYPQYKEMELARGEGFIDSEGAVGYLFSYIRLLKQARREGHQRILILEDDVILSRDFTIRAESLFQRLPPDWKILHFGASQYNWSSVNLTEAARTGYYEPTTLHTCGSFALALDSSVFDQLIESAEAFEAPLDHLTIGELYEQERGRCFVCYPGIVMPDVTQSHIRHSRDQLTHSKLMKWRLEHFEFPPAKPLVSVLVERPCELPWDALCGRQENSPFHLLAYVNTDDGLRPIHSKAGLEKYHTHCRSFSDHVQLPASHICLRLTPGASLAYEELLAALAEPESLAHSPKLTRRSFSVSSRVPGRVSVILPTYKRSDHLFTAIDSVLDQKGIDLELLIVDDNGDPSPLADDVQNYLQEKLPHGSDKARYLQHTRNLNGAAARNTGLMASTGEFITFLDDDDIYLPGRLSETVKALEAEKRGFGGVYCGFLGWNSPTDDADRYPEENLELLLLSLNYKAHYLHTSTITYRFDALIHTNGFDEAYLRHQDIEFNLRFLQKSTLGPVPKALVRLNPNPSTQDNRVFGVKLLEVKRRFFKDFAAYIQRFDGAEQQMILAAHRDELIRYSEDTELLKGTIFDANDHELEVQLLQKLFDDEAASTKQTSQPTQSRPVQREDKLKAALDQMTKERDEANTRLKDIENSLTWRLSRVWRFIP